MSSARRTGAATSSSGGSSRMCASRGSTWRARRRGSTTASSSSPSALDSPCSRPTREAGPGSRLPADGTSRGSRPGDPSRSIHFRGGRRRYPARRRLPGCTGPRSGHKGRPRSPRALTQAVRAAAPSTRRRRAGSVAVSLSSVRGAGTAGGPQPDNGRAALAPCTDSGWRAAAPSTGRRRAGCVAVSLSSVRGAGIGAGRAGQAAGRAGQAAGRAGQAAGRAGQGAGRARPVH